MDFHAKTDFYGGIVPMRKDAVARDEVVGKSNVTAFMHTFKLRTSSRRAVTGVGIATIHLERCNVEKTKRRSTDRLFMQFLIRN